MRLKFIVAYDGTDFRGWAISPGHRTVQDVLTQAIHRVSGEQVEVIGASRTDSGAHAKGQVCHFDTEVPIPVHDWPRVVNRILPADVSVLSASRVGPDFHSRFCAEDRWYRYRIRIGGRDPFESRYAYDHGRPLDLEMMQAAGKLLEGRHDFRAFTEELQPHIDNTVRTLRRVDVKSVHDEIWIEIGGTAFLRGMMRRISGALLEIGAGRRDPDTMPDLLGEKREGMHWPVVLPAKGLTLIRVRYGNPPRDCRNKGE
ncbi:MAG TPA: tRNA pseudouridine(38-40) synthase TruA [Fimbriimonadaceae bacterium]|nr:tRNA pseudouridine(38-40) synthase TruA [Fimbriimonadaceae bacterium]